MRKEGVFTWGSVDSKSLSYIWGFQSAGSGNSPANLLKLFGTGGTSLITVDPAQGNTVVSGTFNATGGMPASNLTGTIATARLGSGTANSTSVLFGDQTWKAGNAAAGPPLLDGNAMLPAYTSPSLAGAGTITSTGTTALVGTSTTFTTQCKVGSYIKSSGSTILGTVVAITDDTHLTLAKATTGSGLTYSIYPPTFQGLTANTATYRNMTDGNGQSIEIGDTNHFFNQLYNPNGFLWFNLIDNSGNWYLFSSSSNGDPFYIDHAAPSGAVAINSTNTTFSGNVIMSSAGSGLQLKGGSNARIGTTAAMTAGSITVSNTSVASGDMIIVSIHTPGGTVGAPFVSARTNGTGFTVKSTNGADTSTIDYLIVGQN